MKKLKIHINIHRDHEGILLAINLTLFYGSRKTSWGTQEDPEPSTLHGEFSKLWSLLLGFLFSGGPSDLGYPKRPKRELTKLQNLTPNPKP